MSSNPSRSSARFRRVTEGVHVRDLGDEMVLHIEATDTWHSLDATSTTVLRAADGAADTAAIVAATGLPADTVDVVLAELVERGLVTMPAGMDRRSLLRRGALLGGAAAAGPGILSLMAPAPMAAASPVLSPATRISLRATEDASLFILAPTAPEGFSTLEAPGATAGLRSRATFIVRPPLAGGTGISLESLSTPGNYLRHFGWFIKMSPAAAGNEDFVFVMEVGKNGSGMSFHALQTNFSGQYIRRYTGTAATAPAYPAAPDTPPRITLTSGNDGVKPNSGGTPGTPYNLLQNWERDVSFFIADPLVPAN